jgi:hypothetical protein
MPVQPAEPPAVEPDALIEEARRWQRRRARRRTAALLTLLGLVILGLGVDRVANNGKADPASKPRSNTAAAARQPRVIYEKIEMILRYPHHQTFRRIGEVWFSPTAPWTYRERLTIAGGPTLEIGAAPGHDPEVANEIRDYLYDARANTVYETGASIEPAATPPRTRNAFRRSLPVPGVRLEGTRLFDGQKVYVAVVSGGPGRRPIATVYFDTATYRPLLYTTSFASMGIRLSIRVLTYRVLPATPSNLNLASLARAHPRAARVLHWPPPPRIHQLYDEANHIGTFVDLGPDFAIMPRRSG